MSFPGEADFLAAQPATFCLCAFAATISGLFLALLDRNDVKDTGGNSPTAHILSCADSADQLFAGISADGAGLGLLEPMWKLFTPDGALWTILTSGVFGLATAAFSFLHVLANLLQVAPAVQPAEDPSRGPVSPSEEKMEMSRLTEFNAYFGYVRMFAVGVFREYAVRVKAYLRKDETCKAFLTRERWNSGWVDFYHVHMYKYIVDCFNNPIGSAPDATFDLIERHREGGWLFGPLHEFNVTRKVRSCVNLGSYNYLGFGGVDEYCTPKAREAALTYGFSSGGARTEGGTVQLHRDLEEEVARYLGKEDALVLGMGFATNSTILPALFEAQAGGTGVLVLSDELNHRSIVEGVRLSGSTVRAFKHNNMQALEAALQRAVAEGQSNLKPWRKIFIVVEGIYSMEGDFCRLREIVTLKNKYKAYLYLDEAHSIGAVGPTGRGVAELLGVPTSEIEVMMGTFTKSFGSAGGYVAASKDVVNALRCNAPGSLFASAMAPPCAAQALAAFRVISGSAGGSVGAEKLASIRENSNFFRRRLEEEGFKVIGDVDSPIIPVMLCHPYKMARFSRMCLARGIAVVIVGYPAVPVLFERVRFCISASHNKAQLEKVVSELADIGRTVGVLHDRNTDKRILEKRQVQAKEFHNWLRNAPLELAGSTKPAPEARYWCPEPLVPKFLNPGVLADSALASVTKIENDSEALDFRTFDPVGYRKRPAECVKAAINKTMDVYGFGACGPRGFYGTTLPHLDLEDDLAKFFGTEAAINYSAGVATVSSVLPALTQAGAYVIVDNEVNLGIRTGLRLCKNAKVSWTPHCSGSAVEAALQKICGKTAKEAQPKRIFIVVETLYQRTGRLAPLKELVELKERYGALLIIDESLAFGTLGRTGRGLFEHVGVDVRRIDGIIGSLEHAVAGVGGFCAGRETLINHQRLAGAGYCYSAAPPPSSSAAASAIIKDFAEAEGCLRRSRLSENAAHLHKELNSFASKLPSTLPLELVSCPESFVQYLRWRGKDAAAGEAALLSVVNACKGESRSLWLQVCSPSACSADAAFGNRTGAPPSPMPSLRFCTNSEHSPEDIGTAILSLSSAIQAV